jgi:hypothetical protein
MQSISVGPAIEIGSVTPRYCPLAAIPALPAAATEGGFVDARRWGEGYQKLKTKKRHNKQKLQTRNLGPVRPSVRPSSRRSPARHVKLQTKRKNTTIHAKHKPKAPSQWSPRPNPRVADEDSGDCKRQKDATSKSSKNKGLKREKNRTAMTREKREEGRKGY